MRSAWLSLILCACGGVALEVGTDGGDGGRRDGGRDVATRDRVTADHPGMREDRDDSDLPPPYPEDACPDLPPPPPILNCDPLKPHDGCPSGEACYPYPPEGQDRCHPGPYTTDCASEGYGAQGSPCYGMGSCTAGYVCVVSGSGDQCVKLCDVTRFGSCSDGLVCEPLDVVGFGGCL
jgi:hypothetical protein